MTNWNKGCWINFVVGILLLITGSMDEVILIMFLGMFNLLYFSMYWALEFGLLNNKDTKQEKKQ